MTQQPVSYPLLGGLNLVTAPLNTPPGHVIAALNYEPVAAGYRRITGYERFDGQPAPSDASYSRLNYTDNVGSEPSPGDFIRDSTASGNVHRVGQIIEVVVTTGSWAAENATGYVVAANMTHDFTGSNAFLSIAPSPLRDFTVSTQIDNYDFGATLNATYLAAAQAFRRSAILAVPGSGSVRGVWVTPAGDIIAFRDNAGATAGAMWQASTAGWIAVPSLTRIDFTCDTATQTLPTNVLIKIGAGVANASASTSDGTIRAIAITDTVGTVNTGHFLVSGYVAGQFTAGGQTIYQAGATTVLGTTTAAASSATIPAGGRYFFINENFYGSEDREAMYFVNGVGPAIVYDGIGFANIVTGMTVDTPTRIAAHRKSLFLAFPGGSVQFSEVGEPLVFDAVLGAGEIGIGSDVTDLISATKSALAILGERSINMLYGSDSTDYLLETLTDEAGAIAFTAQKAGQVIYLDNAGLRTLASSATFGNFRFGSLSELVSTLLEDFRKDGVQPIASFTIRRQNQYWLCFDNDTVLVVHIGRKNPEFMPIVLLDSVTCACSVEVGNAERIFFGSDDGFVYELEKGTSFDGDPIEHYLRLPFNTFGSPEFDKRAHKFILQMETSGTVTLAVDVAFDFGSVPGMDAQSLILTSGAGAIDDLGSNEGYFASQIETVGEVYVDGVAKNFSVRISGETDDEEPHTLTSATWHLSQRRLVR